MPAPISYAHKLTKRLAEVRKSGLLGWVRPDGKAQVSIEYGDDGSVSRCEAVVISTQHDEEIPLDKLRSEITEHVIKHVLPANLIDKNTKIYVIRREGSL
jgi:S-adenosylmethionine synthetase